MMRFEAGDYVEVSTELGWRRGIVADTNPHDVLNYRVAVLGEGLEWYADSEVRYPRQEYKIGTEVYSAAFTWSRKQPLFNAEEPPEPEVESWIIEGYDPAADMYAVTSGTLHTVLLLPASTLYSTTGAAEAAARSCLESAGTYDRLEHMLDTCGMLDQATLVRLSERFFSMAYKLPLREKHNGTETAEEEGQ